MYFDVRGRWSSKVALLRESVIRSVNVHTEGYGMLPSLGFDAMALNVGIVEGKLHSCVCSVQW